MASVVQTRSAPATVEVDPVTLDIIENALRNIREEMDATLFRTAMSPGIREQHDEFPLITDRQGRMVVGQFGSFIHGFLEAYDGEIRDGDVFFTSDPYHCGGAISHANDWLILLPIFRDGLLVGWSSMFGHMTDVGGKVPGSLPTDATSIYEEGVVVPPFRLFRAGEFNAEAFEVILNQVRIPEWNRADLNGVVAGCRVAARRVLELCDRFGEETYLSALDALLDRNLRAMRELITRHIPTEPVTFADYVDDDGLGRGPFKLMCTMWREGDRVVLDWTGTSPQATGPINYYLNKNILKMYFGIYMIMVFDPQVLWNDGFYPLVDVRYPERSLLTPERPAALSCRTHALGRVFDVLGGLLGQQQPHFLNGAGFSSSPHLMYSGRYDNGDWFQLYQIGFGGVPGRRVGDGPDGHSMWPSFTNVPNEYLERYYPLRIERYETVADSGGAGLHRGGNAVEVAYRFLQDGEVSIHDDRWFTYPWGVNGGQPGARSRKLLERAGRGVEVLPAKCDRVQVRNGDLLRYITWGGGGWGDPLERDPENVWVDVARGLVSAEGAQRYGVVIGADGSVDAVATDRLRDKIRRTRPPTTTFDLGPAITELRETCLAETGLPAPLDPAGPGEPAEPAASRSVTSEHATGGLAGKVAVVTGAGTGLGLAAAAALAEAGATVVLPADPADRQPAEVAFVVARAIGAAALVDADLSGADGVTDFLDRVHERCGRLDVVVAVPPDQGDHNGDLSGDGWSGALDGGLLGMLRIVRGAAGRLGSGGSIVCLASSLTGAAFGQAGRSGEAAANAAVLGLVRSLADELGPHGIRVNAVVPGLLAGSDEVDDGKVAERVPLRRPGDPVDVAAVVRFLASGDAAYVTGQSFVVDGGLSSRLAV
jgi:N-methylhydantoinase B